MAINPPPTLDDEFDHDEETQVEHSKDTEDLQKLLDHAALVEFSKRLAQLEEHVSMLRDLVRQLIERVEGLYIKLNTGNNPP